jgi:hypothetical protein
LRSDEVEDCSRARWGAQTRPVRIARRNAPPFGALLKAVTDPVPRLCDMWAEQLLRDGYGYWPAGILPAIAAKNHRAELTVLP